VISPLIALMKDQIDFLERSGIEAARLDSSLDAAEQRAIFGRLQAGSLRLLYVAPERFNNERFLSRLAQARISLFAVDEAHCISEWGHEFRPEYRQLSCLRVHFPDRPIAAFTASATQRVRHDILEQLQLREPDKYIASFHRPNLRYLVKECHDREQSSLLVRILRNYPNSNVIVYAPTIARVEETVDFLEEQGIAAVGYHGKMDTDTRRRNQERWTSDEVRVLVGTIAFGLGINKAAVRSVIHLSLPKSIEQYYQEAGRAGRDGEAADCILLWQKRDTGLLAHFIEQVSDPAERERGWQRYHAIRRFAESGQCRHSQICSHFGEKTKWTSCGACDVCGCESQWLLKSMEAEPTARTQLSMPEVTRVRETSSRAAESVATGADSELRDYIREWRREMSKEQGVPAYIVMHDTSLEDLCRRRPTTLTELLGVSGFGERKTELYGQSILDALARFDKGARAAPLPEKKSRPAEDTLRLLAEGRTFEEIAKIRGRQLASVVSLVADLVEKDKLEFQSGWVESDKQRSIESACARLGIQWLKPLKEALPPEISFEEIRLIVARLRQQQLRESA